MTLNSSSSTQASQSQTSPNVTSVLIIGAGPIGIAAAAHALNQGLKPIIIEKGESAGHAIAAWGHVRVFTPWKYLVDKAVQPLLEKTGWQYPDKEALPSGQEIVERYLIPAAQTPELSALIQYQTEVIAVAKTDLSKASSSDRDSVGYRIHIKTSTGQFQTLLADAVIDASGTWSTPNPIGLDGLPVAGERENTDLIHYGIPDVLNKERQSYAGQRTLVLGGGHSAINVALDLLKLQQENSAGKIHWGLRRNNLEKLLGGGINDKLPARGELGLAAKGAIDTGALTVLAPLKIDSIERQGSALTLSLMVDNIQQTLEVDRIVVAVGFRPDLEILRELRLNIDEIVEAPKALAPLIDPNLHSCGTVRPHGVEELAHHDKNFFIVGMKAYGRAPTFLMMTGYEQVRSIMAELAGDHAAARRVELVLPETGACSSDKLTGSSSACCTPNKNTNTHSCCS